MAYTLIPATWIEVGKPTKRELFELIRNNLIDHEARISTAEAATNQSQVVPFEIFGNGAFVGVQDGLMYYRLPANWSLLAGRIVQYNSTDMIGTLQMDLKFKRGANPFISIFSVTPSVTAANGDNYVSTNGVLLESSLLAGDILRCDVLGAPTAGHEINAWSLNLEYEVE